MFSYKILLLFFFLLILSFLLGYMSTFLNNYDDIKLIEDIALKNASLTEYERSVYDCSEFSENLIETLNKLDYNAISVCGYTNYLDFYKILEYDCKPNSINKKLVEYSKK